MSLRAKLSLNKTTQAREAQKKALAEARVNIANNQLKQADPPADPPDQPSVADPPSETTKNVLTTTQWLSVISIIVSLVGVYYKREEIKNVFAKKATPPRAPPPSTVSQ